MALIVASFSQETDTENTETEMETSTPGVVVDYEPEYKPSRPRFSDKFDRWMKVLNEFFTEGNWLNGGPDNLMEFITKTLTKLLDILLPPQIEKGNGDKPGNSDRIGNADRFSYGRSNRRPSVSINSAPSSSSSSSSRDTSGLTISDLIKMLPQDSLNIPVDRIMGGNRRF